MPQEGRVTPTKKLYATRMQLPSQTVSVAREQWEQGATVQQVAATLGVSLSAFRDLRAYGCLRSWPSRQGMGGGRPLGFRHDTDGDRLFLPAERAEVERRREAVWRSWDEDTRLVRRTSGAPDLPFSYRRQPGR